MKHIVRKGQSARCIDISKKHDYQIKWYKDKRHVPNWKQMEVVRLLMNTNKFKLYAGRYDEKTNTIWINDCFRNTYKVTREAVFEMKIKEYIVVNDTEKHPKLKEKNVIKWNDDFLEYSKIVKFLNDNYYMNILAEEYVYVLSFNCQMEILGVYQLSHGNSMESKNGMRELGIFLLLTGAEKFVVAHNHPNGSCKISGADFNVTNRMLELSRLIDIELVQNFVIGYDSYDTTVEVYEEYGDEEEDDEDDELPFQ